MGDENKNKIATLDQKLAQVKSVKDLFAIPDIKQRFIKNYEAVTGRKDGENRLEQEKFAYLEVLNEKPALRSAPMFSHFAALVKAATTGLSYRDNKLYVQPVKDRDGNIVSLKVTSSPAGKREQFEMMPNVKQAPEAQVVVKGDVFIEDKLNHKVLEHRSTDKSLPSDKLENITHSYQRIIWKDGTVNDVVVPHSDLVKAKAKSKIKSVDEGLWVDFVAEACKKTATNRAFRLYHKYPDNVVLYDKEGEDTDEVTTDVSHQLDEPETPNYVDTDTGEVTEARVVQDDQAPPPPTEEPKTRKSRTAVQGDLL